jgi:hypothetical protein
MATCLVDLFFLPFFVAVADMTLLLHHFPIGCLLKPSADWSEALLARGLELLAAQRGLPGST